MTLQDHFRGVLIGQFVGDALGMPVEGASREQILQRYRGPLDELLRARLGRGTYTDDTQMAIGLAEALLETPGELDLDRLAARFAANYDPSRGYGGNVHGILDAIRDGESWRQVVERRRLPGGSFANGAAMRVAPVALAFFDDESTVADAADRQTRVTGHDHPEARFAAVMQALAVHRALQRGLTGEPFDPADFARQMADRADRADYRDSLGWIADHLDATPEQAIHILGVGGRAVESVPAAFWAFASRTDDPEAAIVQAVNLGGDADTIGAMTGAIAGGYSGCAALPDRWVERLEDQAKGRTYVLELADRLAALHE